MTTMKLICKHFILMTITLCCLLSANAQAQFFSQKTNPLLPEEQAFVVNANTNEGVLNVDWNIAADYYMYREQFKIESSTPGVTIGAINFPTGQIENDPEFGDVEVYFYNALLSAPIVLQSNDASLNEIELIIKGLGCNKPVGVCYPPQTRKVTVSYTPPSTPASTALQKASPTNKITTKGIATEPEESFWAYVLAALGGGLLLSFTPCVLPMIPILLGMIAGQNNPSRLQSGWLAICYVLGTMVTYAIAGWAAGASGIQLQAYAQSPWVIVPICVILIGLALSLFGLFKIQLPSSIQTKLNGTNVTTRSASISSFILGLISALVVGACVSPILIITLGAAISQGDPVLGAAIMTAMALGMGTLLIVVGFGAGWLLPKTGAWMNHVLVTFGFMVLGVAIYLISNLGILPTLFLWVGLFIFSGFYLFKISDEVSSTLTSSLIKAIALILLLWGCLALIGGFIGDNDNVLKPLDGIVAQHSVTDSNKASSTLPFKKTITLEEVQRLMASAKTAGKPVLINFYADWCPDCKRMHRTTFKKASVAQALNGWELIEIDVTETGDISEQAKRFFGVYGPPATLFFKSDGQEHTNLRQYGYMSEDVIVNLINKARG